MKCRVREKIYSEKKHRVVQSYANCYYDFINKAMLLALSETYGFRGKRLERIVYELPVRTTKELEKYEPTEMTVKTKQGHKKASEANRIMDAIKTLSEVNLKNLTEINYNRDFGKDFSFTLNPNRSLAVQERAKWYIYSGHYIGICYTTQFMLLLNELYGFGASRIEKWYIAFLEIYRKWINSFIGADSLDDRNIFKVRDEVDDRLSALHLSVVTDLSKGDDINVENI